MQGAQTRRARGHPGVARPAGLRPGVVGVSPYRTTPRTTPATNRVSDQHRQRVVAAGLLNTGFEITGPLSYLEALGVLAGVVGVHELGHFSAAALQSIYVKKFAVGFGPILFSYKDESDPNSVEFSLRAIPLGALDGCSSFCLRSLSLVSLVSLVIARCHLCLCVV